MWTTEVPQLHPDLEVWVDARDGVATVRLSGELDGRTARTLRSVLSDVIGRRRPSVDLALDEVSFVDPSALNVLVGLLRRTQLYGGRLTCSGVSGPVRRAMEAARLDEALLVGV